jgi:hypothetical protein
VSGAGGLHALLDSVAAAGGSIRLDGEELKCRGPRALLAGWSPAIRLHRDRILLMLRGDALDRELLRGHPEIDTGTAASLAQTIDNLSAYRAELVEALDGVDELAPALAERVEAYRLAARWMRGRR